MRKVIPAHTIIRCDGCGEKKEEHEIVSGLHLKKTYPSHVKSYELCKTCTENAERIIKYHMKLA